MAAHKSVHPGLVGVIPGSVIDKSSPIPLHYQLELFLRQGIENGRFLPNQTLPTELELQEYFDLSRTPIRQAISKLAAEGLVERRRSQGTVVVPHPFDESLTSLTSFTEEVLRKGHTPQSRLLEFAVLPADHDDMARLNLSPRSQVYHIRRVRYIDGQPIGILLSHLPVAILPGLEASLFSSEGPQQSTYYILETIFHLKLVHATEVIHAVTLGEDDAQLLNLPPNSPVLHRNRVTYDSDGRAVAWERGLYHVRYQLEWTGREVKRFDRSVG